MQGVWVFADAAARTAAVTSPQEGNISFLKDTNSTEYYSGSAWVAIDGSVPTSYGFTAGKNKIINGDFGVWQRGTSFSNPADGTFSADRWKSFSNGTGVTRTISQQTFTPGTAPVAGYEGTFFYRYAVSVAGTGNTYHIFDQNIEDVRTFAGQTATLSFWAKADAARTVAVNFYQSFGSGGSGDVSVTSQNASVTTSWQRFTLTYAIPSISGKTIGTNSFLGLRFTQPAGVTMTMDYWGVQVESGSTATAFQTATGTIQGELAACQRYYLRPQLTGAYAFYATGAARSTTVADFCYTLPVSMRVVPTAVDYSNAAIVANGVGATALTNLTIDSPSCSTNTVALQATVASGLTQFRFYYLGNNNNSAGYVGLNAEL
jgi:hypothetical protein